MGRVLGAVVRRSRVVLTTLIAITVLASVTVVSVREAYAARSSIQFAVILCKYKGDTKVVGPDVNDVDSDGDTKEIKSVALPTASALRTARLTPAINYFQVVSSGKLSIASSVVVGWFDLPWSFADKPTLSRTQTGERCRDAADAAGTSFGSKTIPIAVHNRYPGASDAYVRGGLGCDYGTGITDPTEGGVVEYVTPGDVAAHSQSWWHHEMLHTLGLCHSYSNDTSYQNSVWSAPGEYGDRWDIMSARNVFENTAGGPWLNTFGLEKSTDDEKGYWLLPQEGRWIDVRHLTQPMTFTLGAFDGLTTTTPLRFLNFGTSEPVGYSYNVELRMKRGLDSGIPADDVIIHRRETGKSILLTNRGSNRGDKENGLLQQVIDEELGIRITHGPISTANGGSVSVTVSPRVPTGGEAAELKIVSSGPAGDVGPRHQWTRGWTNVKVFRVGGKRFLFLYKQETGEVHIHEMNTTGTVGRELPRRTWDKRFTITEFYEEAGKTFLLLYKGGTYDKEQHGETKLVQMNADGTPGPEIGMGLPKNGRGKGRWVINGQADNVADLTQVVPLHDLSGTQTLVALQVRSTDSGNKNVRQYVIDPKTGIPDLNTDDPPVLSGANVDHRDLAERASISPAPTRRTARSSSSCCTTPAPGEPERTPRCWASSPVNRPRRGIHRRAVRAASPSWTRTHASVRDISSNTSDGPEGRSSGRSRRGPSSRKATRLGFGRRSSKTQIGAPVGPRETPSRWARTRSCSC